MGLSIPVLYIYIYINKNIKIKNQIHLFLTSKWLFHFKSFKSSLHLFVGSSGKTL